MRFLCQYRGKTIHYICKWQVPPWSPSTQNLHLPVLPNCYAFSGLSKPNFSGLFIHYYKVLFIAIILHLVLNGAATLACLLCIPYFTHWCSHYNLPKPQCHSIHDFKNTNHLACLYWHKHIFCTDSAKARGEGRPSSERKLFNRSCLSSFLQPIVAF